MVGNDKTSDDQVGSEAASGDEAERDGVGAARITRLRPLMTSRPRLCISNSQLSALAFVTMAYPTPCRDVVGHAGLADAETNI